MTEKETRDHIRSRLQINRLLTDVDNLTLQQCMNGVTELFGGIQQIISFIAMHTTLNNSQKIHELIKKIKIEYQHRAQTPEITHKINKNEHEDKDDTDDDIMEDDDDNLFELLPNECLDHICGYLARCDISSFKLCSRQISLSCLDQMDKVTVGILPYNLLLDLEENVYHLEISDKALETRHNATKRYSTLFAEWGKLYNIAEENQMLFIINLKYRGGIKSTNMENIIGKKIATSSYLLFDKRKLVILNKNECRLFDPNKDKLNELCRYYDLMILEYFDIKTQSFQIVQFILYRIECIRYKELYEYIENMFIKMDDNLIDNKWYDELSHCLKQMCFDKDQTKLCIFQHESQHIYGYNDKERMNEITNANDIICGNLFTFQLNSDHPWFDKTNKFDKIMIDYNNKMEQFEFMANDFCKNNRLISIHIKNNKKLLKKAIEHYYDVTLNKTQQRVFKKDIKSLKKIINKGKIKMNINISLSAQVLKYKISKIFDGIIDPKHIQLSQMYNEAHLKNTDPIQSTEVLCHIVLYDTNIIEAGNYHKHRLYTVRIFAPYKGPYPYYIKNNVSIIVQILYGEKFVFTDFINYLFEFMRNKTDHILYPQYKHLVDTFYNDDDGDDDNNDDDDDDCDMEQNMNNKQIKCNGIGYVLGIHEHSYRVNPDVKLRTADDLYENPIIDNTDPFALYSTNTNQPDYDSDTDFDLFLIPIKPISSHKDKQLIIKFVYTENNRYHRYNSKYRLNVRTKFTDLEHLNYVGLPLNIWINRNIVLQEIVDIYIKDKNVKDCILSCWRVSKCEQKIIQIRKRSWSDYQPWFRFLWNNPNDFIIFSMMRLNDTKDGGSITMPSYSDIMYDKLISLKLNITNCEQKALEIFRRSDKEYRRENKNKIISKYLLTKSELDVDERKSLNMIEKEELKRGFECCLDTDSKDVWMKMYRTFKQKNKKTNDSDSDNDDDDLNNWSYHNRYNHYEWDLNVIDKELQVKLYNYMLQVLTQQQCNQNVVEDEEDVLHIVETPNINEINDHNPWFSFPANNNYNNNNHDIEQIKLPSLHWDPAQNIDDFEAIQDNAQDVEDNDDIQEIAIEDIEDIEDINDLVD